MGRRKMVEKRFMNNALIKPMERFLHYFGDNAIKMNTMSEEEILSSLDKLKEEFADRSYVVKSMLEMKERVKSGEYPEKKSKDDLGGESEVGLP